MGMEVGRIWEILGKGAKCDAYELCKKLYNVLYEKKKGKKMP